MAHCGRRPALGCSDVLVNGMADHVHIVCRFPPALSLSELVRQLKGVSSHFINHRLGVSEFRWQSGYGAFTLDRTTVEKARYYVLNQKQHHRQDGIWVSWEETEFDD